MGQGKRSSEDVYVTSRGVRLLQTGNSEASKGGKAVRGYCVKEQGDCPQSQAAPGQGGAGLAQITPAGKVHPEIRVSLGLGGSHR